MRTLAAILLGLLLLTPAGTLAAAGALTPLPEPAVDAALADAARFHALAAAFPAGAGLAEQLASATGAHAAPIPEADFGGALAALYAEAGLALPASYARPEPALAAELAPVLMAAAVSARMTNDAFAALTPDERAFVLANLAATTSATRADDADGLAAQVQALALEVDAASIAAASVTLAVALDAFSLPAGTTTSWSDPSGLIEVGSTGDDAYCAERLLIIDLGGNDLYDCHAASYAPGSTLPLPLSAILDLGGNDRYVTSNLHASSATSTWGQAVGIGGIGIIADRWGDDVYASSLWDASTVCPDLWTIGSEQYVYAQAVGALGVGALLDLSGNDVYTVANGNSVFNYCHFAYIYTFAQGAGLARGVGLLVDDTGDDQYHAYTYADGKADNIATTFAQGVAAGGVGALVDKEGSDVYYAQSVAYITLGYVKGAFAYVFSQASVTATRRQPTPTLGGDATGADLRGLCPALSPQQSLAGGACDAAGVALLIDLLGNDQFYARAYADDVGRGCGNGLWSVVSSQGSAAWSGVAALVNVDVEGTDSFALEPYASANHCGYPGVRAHAYGQGYGGPILWDFWDMPLPQGVEQLPIGILASVGVPEETCTTPPKLAPPTTPLDDAIALPRGPVLADPCRFVDQSQTPRLTASPDRYTANAVAMNPQWIANAESWVQGASGRTITIPSYWTGVYPALGVGVHVDVGGDDAYGAYASADGPRPDAWVRAQSSTRDAFAVLANVGGSDVYDADARHNGASDVTRTLVQGYADANTGVSTPGPICVTTSLLLLCVFPVTVAAGGVAVFVDAFGYDAYSEAPERPGCMPDGTLLGGWPLGVPLGTTWWGTVIGNPCPSPTPDVGSGTVIGLDWWSEAY